MRKRPLVTYFLLAYALSWAVHVSVALSAHGLLPLALPPALHFAGAYGPAVAALLVTGWVWGPSGLQALLDQVLRWRVGAGWILVATLSPAALFLLGAVIVRLVGGAWPSFSQYGRIAELPQLGWVSGWIVWTVTFGLGEEIGWRGFALPRLQERHGARSATLILGALWALWHLPQFFYNYEFSFIGLLAFTVSTMSGSLVLTCLYNSTGGSVLVAALWHGAVNTAVAGAQGVMAPVVNGFIILAAALIARHTGPDLRCHVRFDPLSLTVRTDRSTAHERRSRLR